MQIISNEAAIDNVVHNGVAMDAVVVNGVIAWTREVTAFSSATSYDNSTLAVVRTNEVIDYTYVSSVSNVLTAHAQNGNNDNSAQQAIFAPTALALSLFRYALVTVRATNYANYGNGSASIQDTALFTNATTQQNVYQTVKIPLSSIGNIYVRAINGSSNPSYLTSTSIAVEKIVLTNS